MAEALITGAVHINTPADSVSDAMAYLQHKVMTLIHALAASAMFFTDHVAPVYTRKRSLLPASELYLITQGMPLF